MAYIRTIDNKEFTYHHEIRAAYPDIEFPETITDDLLIQIGIQVKESDQIEAGASAASDLQIIISYEELDDA